MRNFWVHLHPMRVTRRAIHPLTTFGFGFLSLVLFLILGISGVLLMLYYVPTFSGAYTSTKDIQYAVTFGNVLRSLHRYAAHAMVFVVAAHMLRVFFSGAYYKRTLNWLIGLVLLFGTLGLAFTGYLLPGDQLSYWAVVVSTNLLDHVPVVGGFVKQLLLGAPTVGDPALVRFYMLHIAFLPGITSGMIVWHLWRIRKDGGLALDPKRAENEPQIFAHPYLTSREIILALWVGVVLLGIAMFVDAPLIGPPNIHQPSNPEKTPWYFLFLQEMVSYSAVVGGVVFPGLLTAGLLLVPFFNVDESSVGRLFGSPSERRICLVSLGASMVLFVGAQLLFQHPRVVDFLSDAPIWMRQWMNPASVMALWALLAAGISKGLGATMRGAILASGVAVAVAVFFFSLMGWCRGPGWVFYWPWEAWPHV